MNLRQYFVMTSFLKHNVTKPRYFCPPFPSHVKFQWYLVTWAFSLFGAMGSNSRYIWDICQWWGLSGPDAHPWLHCFIDWKCTHKQDPVQPILQRNWLVPVSKPLMLHNMSSSCARCFSDGLLQSLVCTVRRKDVMLNLVPVIAWVRRVNLASTF